MRTSLALAAAILPLLAGAPSALADTNATLSPTTAFAAGDRQIGSGTSGTRTYTVTGTGTDPVTIQSVALTDPAFTITAGTCVAGKLLAKNETCTVTVGVHPDGHGRADGESEAGHERADADERWRSTGTGRDLGVSVSALSFSGKVGAGAGTAQTVTVTNRDTSAYTLGAVTVSAQFTKTADGCGATALAGGESCTISVAFAPTSPGAKSGTIALAGYAPAPVDAERRGAPERDVAVAVHARVRRFRAAGLHAHQQRRRAVGRGRRDGDRGRRGVVRDRSRRLLGHERGPGPLVRGRGLVRAERGRVPARRFERQHRRGRVPAGRTARGPRAGRGCRHGGRRLAAAGAPAGRRRRPRRRRAGQRPVRRRRRRLRRRHLRLAVEPARRSRTRGRARPTSAGAGPASAARTSPALGHSTRLEGSSPGAFAGTTGVGCADVNGDGLDDVLVGAWAYEYPGRPVRHRRLARARVRGLRSRRTCATSADARPRRARRARASRSRAATAPSTTTSATRSPGSATSTATAARTSR